MDLAAADQTDGVSPLVAQALSEPFDGRSIERLSEAIEQEPFNPLLYYYRGRIAYNLTLRHASPQFYRTAVEDLEKAHRGRPTDLRVVETLCCCHIDFRFLDDNPQRALARARALIDYWFAERSNDVRAFAALARWQLANNQPEQAVESCRAFAATTQSAMLLSQLGLAYRELDQHDPAINAFSRALALDPDPLVGGQSKAAIYAARSISQFALGRKEHAKQDLQQSLQVSQPHTWTFFDWYSIVAAHRALGERDRGLVWCDRFIQSVPQCGQSWYLHGALLLDLGRQREAEQDFIKAIQRNPHDYRPYVGLLGSHLSQGDHQQALTWCDRWVEVSPESHDAHRWRGLIHYSVKDYEAALRDLDKSVRLQPQDARSRYHRARTHLALMHYQDAAEDFDQSLHLNPSDTEVLLARARMHYDRGQYERAITDFSAVLKQVDQDPDVWRRRGESWRKLNRNEEALADLNQSIELDPRSATAYDRRGLVHAARKQYADAIADYKKALELNPSERWTHMHLVDAYLAAGNRQAALDFCGKWILNDPASVEPHRSLEKCPPSHLAEHHGTVGEFFGQRGQWHLAGTQLTESVRLNSLNVRRWHLLALAQLADGKRQSYLTTCGRLMQQHGLTEDPNASELIALTVVVGGDSDGSDEPERLVALANQAVESRPDSLCCRCTLAAVLYRIGRQPEALSQLQQAQRLMDQSTTPHGAVADWLPSLLAMTQAQLGNELETQRQLDKARAVTTHLPQQAWPFEVEPPEWSRQLIANVLREQAITLSKRKG